MLNAVDNQNCLKDKNELENELSAIAYDLWIKPLELIDISENVAIIATLTEVALDRINKVYLEQIKTAVKNNLNDVIDVLLILSSDAEKYLTEKPKEKEIKFEQRKIETTLDPKYAKYTFENFVVGNSNNIAYAACKNVAENPAKVFNPLFLYGGVGLGKTHLLLSIGNYVLQHNPEMKVCYTTFEGFMNDYIASIRNSKDGSPFAFREKYRNVDLLLIDDIQFISNKKETQQEFFHTFNDLFQNNKQIVITSDKPPKEISTLEDRLKSRFAMGLIQDLQQPDFETRLEILRKKAEIEQFTVSEEVLQYIAEKIESNVRELEGVLTKVVFFAKISGRPVATISDAYEALKEQIQENSANLTVDMIADKVCDFYNVSKEDLKGKKKNKEIVDPRQICIYIITELLDTPLKTIGEYFGGRDHTTIMHARDKIALTIKTNSYLKNTINDIKSSLTKEIN